MKNISFNLSGKIDSRTVAALRAVKEIAESLDIPFFIVGASARDFVLTHCYGIEARRATKDIDLGIEVAGWNKFTEFKKALIEAGRFTPDPKEPQRLYFDSVPVDIVPFGPIAGQNGKISWPPHHRVYMSMCGFKEAYENSITVRISSRPDLDIKLPTVPGLALMKLVSWEERYPERKKDAEDLILIMTACEEISMDRLYDQEPALLEAEEFNLGDAAVRLLGRDMAKIADPATLKIIRQTLDQELNPDTPYRLIQDMAGAGFGFESRSAGLLAQIEKLRKGLNEKT
ncbi:MAG: nucleotidyl transferase AbiEii/AbiGii toxin family protein [Syntrophales bacterium]|nr:nucleotidyl transferase AbiEii/AbiGii toxin family protein [Syntrophales bacterium]